MEVYGQVTMIGYQTLYLDDDEHQRRPLLMEAILEE